MNITDLQNLTVIFRQYPDVRAVYLFGSRVTEKTHPESDLDLAIIPDTDQARLRKLDILADLARQGYDNVDLVILDTDDIILKYEAIRHNQLIYHTDDFDRGSMYSLVVRQYLDFQPYLGTYCFNIEKIFSIFVPP
ncbi:MAG: nucleotidyltransferase domain-containing protein [Chloroflexi bacterium]|nr:nucleotidyltransferase domain-containing protein [Chloroflexota bacterium]